ncbi:hypothetical protein Tco_1095520 [Tanacetum coccineum]
MITSRKSVGLSSPGTNAATTEAAGILPSRSELLRAVLATDLVGLSMLVLGWVESRLIVTFMKYLLLSFLFKYSVVNKVGLRLFSSVVCNGDLLEIDEISYSARIRVREVWSAHSLSQYEVDHDKKVGIKGAAPLCGVKGQRPLRGQGAEPLAGVPLPEHIWSHLTYEESYNSSINTVMDMMTKFGKLDKFEGHDFRRWQKKMYFLLTTLNVVYVLTTPMPELMEDATVEAIRIRAKWEHDDYICRGHILNDNLSLVQLGSHFHIKESLRAQESNKGKGKEVAGPSVNLIEEGGNNKNNKQKIRRKVVSRITTVVLVPTRTLNWKGPKTYLD